MEEIIKNAISEMNEYGSNAIPFVFILDFELNKPLVIKLNDLHKYPIRFAINELFPVNTNREGMKEVLFEKFPVSYKEYSKSFEKVMANLKFGNSYLVNLTFPTKISINLTLEEIYLRSEAKYKLLFGDEFVVFSPEPFIRIKDNIISTFPMKGTIDASIIDAEEIILANEKEKAEHCTIVDLLRNDLSIVSEKVRVNDFRYIEKIKAHGVQLLQISSKISGCLDANWKDHIGNLLFSLLPAGSISGAPKRKTVEIIKESETYTRGYYTGVFGLFDGVSVDSAVMIRFIEKIGKELYYKSGGGITVSSDPISEYQEMIDKVYVPII